MTKTRFGMGIFAMSASVFFGCFGDDSVTSVDVKASEAQTTQATGTFNTAMSGMMSSDYEYGKEDLTTLSQARASYAEALKLNPGNSSAKFGLALTEVMLAAQNGKISQVINRTIEAPSPFDSKLAEDAPLQQNVLMKKVAKMAATYPEFHEIQDAMEAEMLPTLESAIQKLTEVYQDPTFTMTLTLEGKSRTVGHSESGVVLAGLKALHGLLTLFLSYDLDFDANGSYDFLNDLSEIGEISHFDSLSPEETVALRHVTQLLAPTSTFLSVRPAWQARLSKVHGEFNEAITLAREAVASIPAYSPATAHHILHQCGPVDILIEDVNDTDFVIMDEQEEMCQDPEDIAEVLDGLDSAKKYLNQPYVLKLEDIDTSIHVQLSAYFSIQDAKKMWPRYAFYPESEWSSDKPVFYFTDAQGRETGNLNDLIALDDQKFNDEITNVQLVDALSRIIHFQDPTFQGFLPGATEASLWNLIRKQAAFEDGTSPLVQNSTDVLNPQFILGAAFQ